MIDVHFKHDLWTVTVQFHPNALSLSVSNEPWFELCIGGQSHDIAAFCTALNFRRLEFFMSDWCYRKSFQNHLIFHAGRRVIFFLEFCTAGRYYSDSGECLRCPKGSYINDTVHNHGDCTSCPLNNATGIYANTLRTGATSESECFFVSVTSFVCDMWTEWCRWMQSNNNWKMHVPEVHVRLVHVHYRI